MKNITYLRFNPVKNSDLLPKLVECYRIVFGEAPWNEWKKCGICGAKFGISETNAGDTNSTHCNQSMQDFWPVDSVSRDIQKQINGLSSCWIALDDSSVVGFCWGYPMDPKELERELGFEGVSNQITKHFGHVERVAYQDELGVINEYRKHEVAKAMFASRLSDFISNGLEVGVVRTKTKPPSVTFKWFSRIGYKVIAEYNDSDGRVVMARTLKDLRI